MTDIIVEMTQTIYQPKCEPCISAVTDKRFWNAKDELMPRPFCKNPLSPFFMRIPPCRCECFRDQPASAGEGENNGK